MAKLKDDPVSRRAAADHLSQIIDHLDQIEGSEAVLMSKWLLNKSKYYKAQALNKGFGAIPKDITKGDIVRVDLGINVGDELSDKGQDCHFCLVWARKGFLCVVIPLTKTPQTGNQFAVNLGVIDGLPQNTDTFAKLEAIRSISLRRIKRMDEQPDGKISIKDREDLMSRIRIKMEEVFL